MLKKTLYFLGFGFAASWILGMYFRMMHLPGAFWLIFAGSSGLAYVFLPLMILRKFRDRPFANLSERLMWILGTGGLMLFITSMWFKMLHLQGAVVLVTAAAVVFVAGFLPLFFYQLYKRAVRDDQSG